MWESSLSVVPLFFLSLAVPQFGLLSHISSLRLPSGHSGLVPNINSAARTSLFIPHLLVVDANVWATSRLRVSVRRIISGFYLFIFFLPVMLPSEIPKLPTDLPVKGFPGVWKLLFYNSVWDRSSSLILLSLSLSFIFCPTSLRRQWVAFLGV